MKKLLHFFFAVMPPVGRPDAIELPSKAFENQLTKLVTVACGRGAMVGCAVAFDAKQIAVGHGGIEHSQINSVARAANLVMHVKS